MEELENGGAKRLPARSGICSRNERKRVGVPQGPGNLGLGLSPKKQKKKKKRDSNQNK